jgi:hypothetical protein
VTAGVGKWRWLQYHQLGIPKTESRLDARQISILVFMSRAPREGLVYPAMFAVCDPMLD